MRFCPAPRTSLKRRRSGTGSEARNSSTAISSSGRAMITVASRNGSAVAPRRRRWGLLLPWLLDLHRLRPNLLLPIQPECLALLRRQILDHARRQLIEDAPSSMSASSASNSRTHNRAACRRINQRRKTTMTKLLPAALIATTTSA